MDDFEKNLKDLPRPDVNVDRFKQALRRELLISMQSVPARRLRMALGITSIAASVFGVLVMMFVIEPGLPTRLHAALLDRSPATEWASGAPAQREQVSREVEDRTLHEFLDRAASNAQGDRAFLENWYQLRERPVQVKAMAGERVLTIRQFELSNGERVAVLTELGAPVSSRRVQGIQAIARTF